MSREPALAPKERSDTSIARQGYDQGPTPMPRSERPSDHRPHIPRRPLSTGLSDLMIMPFWFHSPALHSLRCASDYAGITSGFQPLHTALAN